MASIARTSTGLEGAILIHPDGTVVTGTGTGGGGSTSVWSASDAATNGMTLSNGGLTFSSASGGNGTSIRGTVSHTSGKVYIEFLCVSTNTNAAFGLASAGFNVGNLLGKSIYSGGVFYAANGVSAGFTSNITSLNYPRANDVLALAVDFASGSMWLAYNNAWLGGGDPSTGSLPMISFIPATVGALFPTMCPQDAAEIWTLQSTAASQKYAPPSGFSAWDSAAPTHSPQALAYLARTVGGNEGGNAGPIAALIDGLVSDGVWAKLDCLYVLAQQNQSDALLNLIGTSYSLTGIATFSAYHGFSAFSATGLPTGFNPVTAPTPNFTQNSASLGAWLYSISADNAGVIANADDSTGVYPDYSGIFYIRITGSGSQNLGLTPVKGFFTADRSSSTVVDAYLSGVKGSTASAASTAVPSNTFAVGASPGFGPSLQILSAAFIGSSLGASGQLALYTRLNTYMTAVAPTHSPQALAYLARTVGGNEGGNGANIATLIDGLVSDGVWSKLDCLYVLAQQNQTDALLNLVGTSYSLVHDGSTFTAYEGFQGFTAGLNTQFNPATATSPNFTQNSASFGFWAYSIVSESFSEFGNSTTLAGGSHIYDKFAADANFYVRLNDTSAGGVTSPGTSGLYAGDRSVSATAVPYCNGASQGSVSSTSSTPANANFLIGFLSGNSTLEPISAAFIGASLGAAGQLALYNRLRTYMTAIGIP